MIDHARYEPKHRVFQPIEPDSLLWRYMDFTKFVALLEYQAVAFARADTLGDPYEGTSTVLASSRDAELFNWESPELRRAWTEKYRRRTFVSCWNHSAVESDALWVRYVPATAGIAIQTTFQRLADSFDSASIAKTDDPTPLFIGRVSYVDYGTAVWPAGNALWPYVHKRLSFSHENEVRAIVTWPSQERHRANSTARKALRTELGEQEFKRRRRDRTLPDYLKTPAAPPSWQIAVDLSVLIENIFVSPTAPDWFATLVRDVSARYGLALDPKQSSLDLPPIY